MGLSVHSEGVSRIGDFLLKLYFWLKVKFWVYIECVYMEAGAEKSMPKRVSDDQALGSYALQSPPPPLLAEKLPTVCFMSCFFFFFDFIAFLF